MGDAIDQIMWSHCSVHIKASNDEPGQLAGAGGNTPYPIRHVRLATALTHPWRKSLTSHSDTHMHTQIG
jgi:hypothetical protein